METNIFSLNFNVTGPERKRLVKAISEITGADAKYLGAPTFAYAVGIFTIDKNGTVSFDDRADSTEVENLIDALEKWGFSAERTENEETSEENAEAPKNAADGLTIELPLESVKVGNLTNLLNAKKTLIQKALGVEDIRIDVADDKVKFPWFSELPDSDAVKAYTHFISALCEMSKSSKRVTATEKAVDNEKYAFRCFLLRLGFIGSEYKAERKILLKNLTGSSAFRKGGADREVTE